MINKVSLLLLSLISCAASFAQHAKIEPLPAKVLSTLRDSTTSLDVVMLTGVGGSISADGNNVKYFSSFVENKTALKTNTPVSGTIMWLINGREFISGNYYLGDSTGYIVFQKDGREFVNQLNAQGNSFLKSQFKKD
jgi:hypothetical protein